MPTKKLEKKPPEIIFLTNTSEHVYHWQFRIDNYAVWSIVEGINDTNHLQQLPDLDLNKTAQFNLSIECLGVNKGPWKTVFNYWDPTGDINGIQRDSGNWDMEKDTTADVNATDVSQIIVKGAMELDYIGFGQRGCIALAPNGLIVPLHGAECDQELNSVCEYQSCYTTEGMQCKFPFKYKEKLYHKCISEDVYQPWCPTDYGDNDVILAWGLCLRDCVHEPPNPSCLSPPPVPQFGFRADKQTGELLISPTNKIIYENYESNWFSISFVNSTNGTASIMNHTHYLVTRAQRKTLFMPWMVYQPDKVVEKDLEIIVQNRTDFFNDVYEIVPHEGNATYTCPPGYVFEDSKNISQIAYCNNGTWIADFNVTKACIEIVCPEHEVPPFVNGTKEGTNDLEEVKAAEPETWNTWKKTITYKCPRGFVVGQPSNHEEQQEAIPTEYDAKYEREHQTFKVECGDNAEWTPIPFHGGNIMPQCIPINCTEPPFEVNNDDFGMFNWTEDPATAPGAYATELIYTCPRAGWGYPSNGEANFTIRCMRDGTWNNQLDIEKCIKLPCKQQPPPVSDGEGAERIYGLEITKYRCKNGYKWSSGEWPYFLLECLNKKWLPKKLPECIPRSCGMDIPIPYSGMDVSWPYKVRTLGATIEYTCPSKRLTWLYNTTVQTSTCIWHRQTDSMIWWPPELHQCNRTIPPEGNIIALPTLPPYAVEYAFTTNYYWPHITENATQESKTGLFSWEEEETKGPFGFGQSTKLNGDQCLIDGRFAQRGDNCIINPLNCTQGLSFSIWELVHYPRKLIDLDPDEGDFDKKYIVSTGADFNKDLKKNIPGFAIYHHGMDLVAVVSTGEDVWELRVRGQLNNETWTSIGIRWEMPNLDETLALPPMERGGLEMHVNLEKVGHALLPIERPDSDEENGELGKWEALPPLSLPAKNGDGQVKKGAMEGPPVIMFGCHYDQLQSQGKFTHYSEAIYDEMAIWTRKLQVNKTHDETLYFMGGYQETLENMTPEKFAEMLKSVDMTDADQAAAASSMAGTLMSNAPDDDEDDNGDDEDDNGGDEESKGGSGSTGNGKAAATKDRIGSYKLPWKEKEAKKQLLMAKMYSGLLNLDGVQDGALPKHVDSRFNTIPVAARLLSCTPKNVERWKIVQESNDVPGSSEILKTMEKYVMSFAGTTNLSFYDDSQYFNATTQEYIVNTHSDEMVMSIQKMSMANLRSRGTVFDMKAYKEPLRNWLTARALWEQPRDEIKIPTGMFTDNELCKDKPVTFMYGIYPCYANFAPIRRNPVSISASRFVLDSKVITVKFEVNNDTYHATPGEASYCFTDPHWMKYHPVSIRLYHKSRETARRKILHHEDEIKTSIDIRRCVIWNDDIGDYGAWDSQGCTTVMTEQDSTLCECDRFGTYALIAEKIEKPSGNYEYDWLSVSRYIGFSLSLLCLLIFILVIMVSRHLWEMFHLLRLNTGICYFMAMLFHFISEMRAIREDRHANASISSLLLFFYLSGGYFQFCEAFAEFRAITSGIIGGKTIAYLPIGWGAGFIGLGLTWFLYGADIGTDPNCFIGWENETKLPFFIMNYVALGVALLLSIVVIFNASTPQTRKEDVVEDLQQQGQGLAITNFLFVMVWLFAYPAYIKFPGVEITNFYPVFTLFNAWMGVCIFIFLGLSSGRFRMVLAGKADMRQQLLLATMGYSAPNEPEDKKPLAVSTPVESLAPSPQPSRPATAEPSRPATADPSRPATAADVSRPPSSKPASAKSRPDTAPPQDDDPPSDDDDDMEEEEDDMD